MEQGGADAYDTLLPGRGDDRGPHCIGRGGRAGRGALPVGEDGRDLVLRMDEDAAYELEVIAVTTCVGESREPLEKKTAAYRATFRPAREGGDWATVVEIRRLRSDYSADASLGQCGGDHTARQVG